MNRFHSFTASPSFIYVLTAPLFIILFGYVFYPLFQTFLESMKLDGQVGVDNYVRFFSLTRTANWEALLTSLGLSFLSVISCGVVGVVMAFLLARYEFPGRKLLTVLVMVPMALPPLIGVVSFMLLYGESGILPRALKTLFNLTEVPFALKGLTGVIAVHTFTMYTYFYMTVAAAISGLDPSLEEAAYNLGASRLTVWRKVILPMLTPAIIASSLLVFMVSMASYTAPLMFGIDRTMTMQIYLSRTNGNLEMAATQSTVLSVVSVGALLLMRWYQSRRNYRNMSKGISVHRSEVSNPAIRYLAIFLSFIGVLVLLLPILVIVLVSFSVDGVWTTQIMPPEYTLNHYYKLFTDSKTWLPIRNSFSMSFIATAANILFGVAAAYVMVRFKFKGKGLMDTLIMLPWALPGTVVGINLITAFNQPTVFSFNQVLVGTYWIVPLAYFVRHLPLTFRSSYATFSQLDESVEEAARNLGATWWYSFRRVVFPLAIGGIMAGTLLAFVQGIGEFVASILLFTVDSRPISVEIFQRLYSFEFGTACAYGVLQILLIIIVLFLSQKLNGDAGGTIS